MEIDFTLDWDASGIAMMVVAIVIVLVLLMAWWEFYAKPCRDSLRAIEAALNAAPWMQARNNQGLKRSA